MRQEHDVRTGDPETDKMVADEMKSSFEQAGMKVTMTALAGGGYKIVTEMAMPAPVAAAAAQAEAVTGQAFSLHAFEIGGDERFALVGALEAGDLTPAIEFLQRTRAAQDWDDRAFLIDLVAGAANTQAVDALAGRGAGDPDVRLFAGVHHFEKAWEARGSGTADTITDEGHRAMGQHIGRAQAELEAAAALAPNDPNACAFLIGVAQLGGRVDGGAAFQAAVSRHPANLLAHQRMVGMTTEKWGGQLDTCLSIARRGLAAAHAGSDVASVLFRAHFEAWFYRKHFMQDEALAQGYLNSPAVRTELERAFDGWITSTYQPRRSSVTPLHWAAGWFFLAGDQGRMKRAMKLTNNVQPDQWLPWCWISDLAYTQALQASYA